MCPSEVPDIAAPERNRPTAKSRGNQPRGRPPDSNTVMSAGLLSVGAPRRRVEEALPAAVGWCEWRCDYLLLSEEILGAAERGRSRAGRFSKT